MTEVYRHWHEDHFDHNIFEPITNGVIKPNGGYWASPLSGYTWKQWCDDENWYKGDVELFHDFTLSSDARVLVIENMEDAKVLDQYIITDSKSLVSSQYWDIDFEEFSKFYDGIRIDFSKDSTLRWEFYGWDCDTLLIFNPDVMVEYKGEEK